MNRLMYIQIYLQNPRCDVDHPCVVKDRLLLVPGCAICQAFLEASSHVSHEHTLRSRYLSLPGWTQLLPSSNVPLYGFYWSLLSTYMGQVTRVENGVINPLQASRFFFSVRRTGTSSSHEETNYQTRHKKDRAASIMKHQPVGFGGSTTHQDGSEQALERKDRLAWVYYTKLINMYVCLPVPTASPATATEVTPANSLLLVVAVALPLICTEPSTESLPLARLSALPGGGTGVLHAREHGRHGSGIHLAGVHAAGHHLLHHGLHLRRHPVHAWHAGSNTGSSWTWSGDGHRSPAGHYAAHHHHVGHLLKHLLVVLRHDILVVLAAQSLLFLGIERPGELVEAVVEVVG